MGVKVDIALSDLAPFFSASSLTCSTDGVTDSVYFVDNKYILKIFETANIDEVNQEANLLDSLSSLGVPKIITKPFVIKNKVAIIYSMIEGSSIKFTSNENVKEIAIFLKKFHKITKNQKSINKKIYTKEYLKSLIDKANYKPLNDIYDSITIVLKDDGIIHGDLFVDNAKFLDNKLNGVYDFIDSCEGDFLFDLAVVSISWCFKQDMDMQKLDILLSHYDSSIDKKVFKEYIKYAMLYYATTRYIYGRDYNDLLTKIKLLEEIDV